MAITLISDVMKLNFKYIGTLLTVMAVTLSCSRQDDIQTNSQEKLTLADLEVSIEARITDYTDGNNSASQNSRAASATWADGAEIAFALDGSAIPAGKLKYDASTGKWNKLEVDKDATVKAEGGKVCALHARELTIDTKAEGAKCSGNLVYTDAGTYKVADGVIYFTMHLDKLVESRLVISGVAAKAKVLNIKNKSLKSFADMTFSEEDGTGEGTYDEKSKTLTVEGCLPDDGSGKTTLKIQYLDGDKKGHLMTRTYQKKAGIGQSIDISGPDMDGQADEWTDAGVMPTSIMLRDPITGEALKEGQEILCPKNNNFAEVVILPEDAADKRFFVNCNPDMGEGGYIADRQNIESNYLFARSPGITTVTVSTSNGLKATLKLEVIADKTININGFRYNILPGGTLELTTPDFDGKYGTKESQYKGDIVIPATASYKGRDLPVVSIARSAFRAPSESGTSLNEEVTSITIGENVKKMDYYAIQSLPNLKKVKIGKNLKEAFAPSISMETVFIACRNLTTIEVDENNKYYKVENGVLYGRTELTQSPYHYCLLVIPQYTEPVYINGNTVIIQANAIKNVQTTFISIPKSVKDLGRFLFGGEYTKLKTIKLEWSYDEWRTMLIGGTYVVAHINPEEMYFIYHPDINSVIIDVPDEDAKRYGYYSMWSYAIKDKDNSSGRIR